MQLSSILEQAIDQLAREFIQRPFNFYTETDMHLKLFSILVREPVFQYVTKDGKCVNLIHTEFPTFGRYRVDDRHFFFRDPSGVRGAYDLVIWDPASLPPRIDDLAVWRPHFGQDSRPRLLAAIECKLYEGIGKYKPQVHNDLLKLNEPDHLIRYKYMVQFVRNMIQARTNLQYFGRLRQELKEKVKSTGVKIRYVEVRKDAAPIDEWVYEE